MQVRALSAAAAAAAAAAVVVVALCSAACNPATKSKAAATAATPTAAAATAATSAANPSAGSSASAGPANAAATVTRPPAAGGGTVDVCGLLTSAQASSINGVTYGATTPQQLAKGYDSCTYKNNGSRNPVDIQDLTVQVISLADCYTQLKQADGPGTPVSGVGDDAFGYSIGIIVKVGSRCLDVSGLTDAEIQNNYAPDVAMAKIIIAKLS